MSSITDAEAADWARTLRAHFREKLSEWEDGFVISMGIRADRQQPFTDNMKARLEEIMERCARGHR